MKKDNIVPPREKIPRKVKCGVVGMEELRMVKEVLRKERISNKTIRRKGQLDKAHDCDDSLKPAKKHNKKCESKKTDIRRKENDSERDVITNKESGVKKAPQISQLNESGLSHFMDLEERKDLLTTSIDDDPLSINGPEAYDAVGWTSIKQEVPDDIEVSCVTITEIPLKPVEVANTSSSVEIAPELHSTSEPVEESKDTDDINSGSKMGVKDDEIENNSSDSSDSFWWNDDVKESSDYIKEGDNSEIASKPSSKRKSRTYSCDICDKELSSKGSLRLHKKKKHQINIKLNCELCSLTFDLQRDLVKHRNELHRDSNGRFTCKDCGKHFNDYLCFLIHVKIHFEEEEILNGEGDENKTRFKCKECNKVFKREEGLSLHKVMTHNSDSWLSEKLKQPEKNFVCNTCGKRFAFRCLLSDHINLHTGAKPYLCQTCGRSFAQKASLKQHARTHDSVRRSVCSVCNQGFFSNGDLKKHMRKHTGERPYVCEVCGDGFSQSSHLGVHRRSHTGERPFKCDVCSRGFTKKGDVVRHRRIHTGELPYLCQVCCKAFRQSTQCSNHIKNHHPDALVTEYKHPVAISQWTL